MAEKSAPPVVYEDGKAVLKDAQSGTLVHVDKDVLQEQLARGRYVLASDTDIKAADELAKAQTLGAQIETAGRGAAEAVGSVAQMGSRILDAAPILNVLPTVGASNLISKGLQGAIGIDASRRDVGIPGQIAGALSASPAYAESDYEARTRLLRQANPGAYTTGETLGNIGVGLATGGATTALGRGLAGGLARTGVRQGLASTLGTSAAMAAEGGFFGAAQAETDARAAGQTDGATAEQLLQGIGLGSILGGGIGLGLGAAGSAFRKIVSKADDVATPPTAAITEAEAAAVDVPKSSLGNLYNEASAAASGAEKSILEKYGLFANGPEAVEGRALYRARSEIIDKATTEATDAVQKLDRAVEEITTHVRQADMKVQGVGRMMAEDGLTPGTIKSTARREINEGLARLRSLQDALPENEYTKHVRADLKNAIDFGENRFSSIDAEASGEAAYVALDQFKRELQHTKISLTDTANLADAGLTKRYAKQVADKFETEIQEPIRTALEDSGKWGPKAAEAQREINANFHRMFESQSRYRQELFSRGEKDYITGFRENVAESGKVKGWISSVGTTEGQTRQTIVRDHLAATQDLINSIGKHYELSPAETKLLLEAQKASKALNETLGRVDKTARIANEIDSVFTAQKQGLGGIIGGGALTGGVIGGLPGALLGSAAGFVMNPGSGIALRSSLEAAAQRFGVKLTGKASNWVLSSAGIGDKAKAVGRTVGAAAEPAAKAARKAVVPASVSVFLGKHKDIESAYEERTNQLIRAQNDPDYLLDNLVRVSGGLASVSPSVAAAFQAKTETAIAFLASKAPSGTLDPTPLNPGRKSVVSRLEMARFARVWAAVEKPMTVVEDLQRGVATPDQVEALRVVHPETYEAIRASVSDALLTVAQKGKRIPIATRQQLDLLLDLGGAGEPAFSPEVSDRIVKLQQAKTQKMPKPGRAPKLSASSALPQANWPSA